MPCQALRSYVVTDHARLEMQRRNITEAEIAAVLAAPEQYQEVRPGRCVYQSRVTAEGTTRVYLLRVFVDTGREPPQVVTAYRTSKVGKYWR